MDGRNAQRNCHLPAGCGGVFLAIGPRLRASITKKGIIPPERAVWVHIDHPTLGQLGILAVYAPNGKCERAVVWHELADLLDNKRDYVLMPIILTYEVAIQIVLLLFPLMSCQTSSLSPAGRGL